MKEIYLDKLENYLTISMISIIDIRNIKSQRVAEKNGLRKKKQTSWKDIEVYIGSAV